MACFVWHSTRTCNMCVHSDLKRGKCKVICGGAAAQKVLHTARRMTLCLRSCVLSALWGIHEQQRRRQQQQSSSEQCHCQLPLPLSALPKFDFRSLLSAFCVEFAERANRRKCCATAAVKPHLNFAHGVSVWLRAFVCVCVLVSCPESGSWICNFATRLQTAAPRANNNCKLSTEKFAKVPYNQAPAGVYLSMPLPNANEGVFFCCCFQYPIRLFSP